MRFFYPVTALFVILMLVLSATAEAKGGKGGGGGGGRGKPNFGGGGGGGGTKFRGQQSARDGGKVAGDKKQVAQQDKKPAKEKEKQVKHQAKDAEHTDGDNDAGEPTADNKKQKQLANFQRQRDKKLAQAEHLRQISEQNGNPNLAANADRMEAQAHEQYAKKVAHLEKFGVTDPTLDPGGDVTDPLLPDGDPLVDDPLGTMQSLLPLRP